MKGFKRKVETFNQTQSVNFPLTIKVLSLITVVKPLLFIGTEAESGKEGTQILPILSAEQRYHCFTPSCIPVSYP